MIKQLYIIILVLINLLSKEFIIFIVASLHLTYKTMIKSSQ